MTEKIRVLLSESAATVETPAGVQVRESHAAAEATAVAGKPGRFLLTLIDAGKGSSGTYPAETLKAAAEAGVFGKGLHLYANHPTASESYERPERSITDLAGVLAEDARWDDAGKRLVAEANVYSTFRPLLTEAANDIGVSIRALAEAEPGDDGLVITKITEALSADFVTHAGRGGRIMQVLESARLTETATEDERDMLQRALPPRHWLRDFDPAARLVWFSRYDDTYDRMHVWQQEYSQDGTTATLTGTPVEVRQVTTYQPLTGSTDPSTTAVEAATTTPASSAGANPKENHMEISEADYTALKASADRVTTLEAELGTTKRTLAERDARDAATERAKTPLAESKLPDPFQQRALRDALRTVPLTEALALDETAFDAALAEAVKDQTELLTAVTPTHQLVGFGSVQESAPAEYTNAFGRKITKES